MSGSSDWTCAGRQRSDSAVFSAEIRRLIKRHWTERSSRECADEVSSAGDIGGVKRGNLSGFSACT